LTPAAVTVVIQDTPQYRAPWGENPLSLCTNPDVA
jgi:hypothetical protein